MSKPKKAGVKSQTDATPSVTKHAHAPEKHEAKKPATRPMLRAILVTPAVLAAAKAYKKSTRKSFYALGLEAVSEFLTREGFLKARASDAKA